jgi:hypothetical protein
MTSLAPPTRPTAAEIARDPLSLWKWMDDSAGYAMLEAFMEAREERDRNRQRILAALAHKVRQGPHPIVNNTLH